MALEIHTDYDVPHLEELYRVRIQQENPAFPKTIKRSFFLAAGLTALAGVALMLLIRRFMAMGIVFIMLGVWFYDQGARYYRHAAAKMRKQMNAAFTGNDYILDELGIRVENAVDVLECQYEDCETLMETDKNIYIILKDGQGLILDKGNVEGGSVEDLRKCLEDNTGKTLVKMDLQSK